MYGKDKNFGRFGKPGHIELHKFKIKLLEYDLVDFKTEFAEGKIFKCVFQCETIGRYTMYYDTLEKFLNGVEGTMQDKKLLELLEKKKKGMLSEENLKKDLFKLIKINSKK